MPVMWHVFNVFNDKKDVAADLRHEVLGELLTAEPDDPNWPCFIISEEEGPPDMLILPRFQRIRHARTPVYLEIRWHPQQGFSLSKHGYDPHGSILDHRAADKILEPGFALSDRLRTARDRSQEDAETLTRIL